MTVHMEKLVELRRVTRRSEHGTILATEYIQERWVHVNDNVPPEPDCIYVPLSQDRVWEIRADGGTIMRHQES